MSEEIQENRDDESGAYTKRPAAKARPKQTSLSMSSSPRVKIRVNSVKHGGTCFGSNEGDIIPKIHYRIQGLPHSTVEQEDNTRKEVVNKLIHQFEMRPDREALKADLRQNQACTNPLSEKSKNLIHSVENVGALTV